MLEMSFLSELQKKQEILRSDYEKLIMNFDKPIVTEIVLTSEEESLFASMCRWHINSHLTESDWLKAFHNVSSKVDVTEKMEKLDNVIVKFLRKKFKADILKEKFSVAPIIDFLEDHIANLYATKLNSRVQNEEIEFENVIDGRSPKDTMFYEKQFLPAAIIFTYQEIHPECDVEQLMVDVFSIGAGSKTTNLFPETNAICHEWCASVYFPNLKKMNPTNINDLNCEIFKEQNSNHFLRPHLAKILARTAEESCSDESEMTTVASVVESLLTKNISGKELDEDTLSTSDILHANFNPFSSDESELDADKIQMFNPFSSDESISEIFYELPHRCGQCNKGFSVVEFLGYHNKIFHQDMEQSGRLHLATRFVEEGEDLITSLCEPNKIENNNEHLLATKFVGEGEAMITSFCESGKSDEVSNNQPLANEQDKEKVKEKAHRFNLRTKLVKKLSFDE